MLPTPHRIGFLGCGNIAGPYAESLARHPELELVGVFDLDAAKRAEFAAARGCREYHSLDELVDDQLDIVVNLTSAPYHYSSTRELLDRRQTVFSEKPLALEYVQARELAERAEQLGLRLAGAPSLWLGAAAVKAVSVVLSGELGDVKIVTAEVNQGRIESWHPAPGSFYAVGPVFDAGVYPIAYLTAVFGPIRRVSATSSMSLPHREDLSAQPFTLVTPDSWFVIAHFANGVILRLTCTFYVDSATIPRHVDFHGDTGSLRLHDWIMPGSAISVARYGTEFENVQAEEVGQQIDWCIGLADFSDAIRRGRPHRNSADHAAHVVEVLEAISASSANERPVDVSSDFDAFDRFTDQSQEKQETR